MQFAICRSAEKTAKALTEALERQRLRWLRFGHDVFCYSADPAAPVNWSDLELPGARLNVSDPARNSPEPARYILSPRRADHFSAPIRMSRCCSTRAVA